MNEAVRNFVHNDTNKAIESMVNATLEEVQKEFKAPRNENGEDEADPVPMDKLLEEQMRDRCVLHA